MTLPRFMDLKTAAAHHGISASWLWEHVRNEDIPAIRPGRKWLVDPRDVEAWLLALEEQRTR